MKLYSKCVTKAGDVLMLATATGPVLGRKEIAHCQFERWLLKKEILDSRP